MIASLQETYPMVLLVMLGIGVATFALLWGALEAIERYGGVE